MLRKRQRVKRRKRRRRRMMALTPRLSLEQTSVNPLVLMKMMKSISS
jgi:ribosomal protein L18